MMIVEISGAAKEKQTGMVIRVKRANARTG